MSDPNTFYLKPLTAKEALEKWLETAQKLFGHSSVQCSFQTNITNLAINMSPTTANTIHEYASVQKTRKLLSEPWPSIACTTFSITAHNAPPNTSIDYNATEDSIFATITIYNITEPEAFLKYYKILDEIYSFIPKSHIVASNLPIAQQNAIKYQESVLGELRTETAKIAQFNTNQTKEISDFLTKSTIKLEERAREREVEIDLKRRTAEENLRKREEALQEQYKQQLAELEKREEEHKRRVETINAKENMVVRRELLDKITKLIADQATFSLSPSVTEKRQAVRNICIYSMIGSIIWIISFSSSIIYCILIKAEPRWYQYAPLSVGTAFLISTLVYYIKWNDQWSNEHARAESRNKKLNADILRASWLAEMFFEGKDKERILPDLLLSRFSEGLFAEVSTSGPEHPSDQMTDLLKKISSVKVGKDSVELTKAAAEEKK